jgi:threonine dehydrogenase-like Zn-dependent dehydrogenase
VLNTQGNSQTEVRVIEFIGSGRLRFSWRKLPASDPLLRVEVAGVCGTDRHIFHGLLPVTTPRILGHEVIGRLERLSKSDGITIDGDRVGRERVILAPGVSCTECDSCRADTQSCERRLIYGIDLPPNELTGGMAPVMTLRKGSRVVRIPDNLPAERAIFVEAMACVLSGLDRAACMSRDIPGLPTLVMGFGPLGICAATVLKTFGGHVTIVEPGPERRELALKLGFDNTYMSLDEVLQRHAFGDGHFAIALNCAGVVDALPSGLKALQRGGTIVELGSFIDLGPISINTSEICRRDLKVVGSSTTNYDNIARAITIAATTDVDLSLAVTDTHMFSDITDPDKILSTAPVGKAVIYFDGYSP